MNNVITYGGVDYVYYGELWWPFDTETGVILGEKGYELAYLTTLH